MTAEEFFKLSETNLPTQLIDGEIIMSPAATPLHQDIVLNTAILLRALGQGGKVYVAPIDVYLDNMNVFQPEVVWIAADSQCVIADKRLLGAPDVIVEVLSPSTAKIDKTKKFRLYQQHGVREYWIADPEAGYLEAWTLVDGVYQYIGAFAAGEGFDSVVLAKRVDVSAIFPEAETNEPSDECSTPI